MQLSFAFRVVLLSAGLSSLGACERSSTPARPKLPPDAPNVLLLTLDTTRADRLGCYGYAAAQTPALDGLASSGVRFERAFCQVPLTLASHASLLTGLYPPSTGLRCNGAAVLPPTVATVAEPFQAHGYRTGAFVAASVLNSVFGLSRGFDHYDDRLSGGDAWSTVQERPADQVCNAALTWLNERPDQPFLAWVHFFDPHFPYNPPAAYHERCTQKYDGEIAFMDAQIQRLLDWLDAHNCRARTLIVAVGDHGEAFGEHGEVLHGHFIYDVTVHVPLIFSWPTRLPQGKVVSPNVRLVDVAPTLLDLFGWQPAPTIQGESLRSAFEAPSFSFRPVYTETEYPALAFAWAPLHSYTTEQWRYIDAPRPELYDRATDHEEAHNVIAQHPDVATQMRGALEEALAGMPEQEAAGAALDDRAIQALASLGYVAVDRPSSARPAAAARDPKDMAGVFHAAMDAEALMTAHRYADVIPLVEPLVRASPESDQLYALLAEAYLKTRRFDEAIIAYRASLRAVPDNPHKRCRLGQAFAGLGQLEEAIKCYQQVLADRADYSLAHNELGLIYLQQRQFVQAEAHLRRCVELNPDSAAAHDNLALVQIPMGRREEALQSLQKALELSPSDPPAHRLLWQVLVTLNRRVEGLAALRAACQLLPDDQSLQRALAGLLTNTPSVGADAAREAIEIARACCSREPTVPENYDVLSITLSAAGDYASAVQAARQALQLAQQQNRPDLAAQIAQRLQGYEARLPH